MTEDEAKAKWCPMARVGSDNTGLGSLNRDWAKGPYTHSAQCIASGCMMWRWLVPPNMVNVYREAQKDDSLEATGFCGLAGVP